MERMKHFRNLLLLFIFIFVFVEFMSHAFIKSTYTLISSNETIIDYPKVEIIEAKSTNMNGYVKANITNNTNSKIDDKYIKLVFYSKYDNQLGTKYLKISNLNVNDSKEFNMNHKFKGVAKITGEIVDEAEETSSSFDFTYNLPETGKLAWVVGGLVVLYYLPARFLFKLFPF